MKTKILPVSPLFGKHSHVRTYLCTCLGCLSQGVSTVYMHMGNILGCMQIVWFHVSKTNMFPRTPRTYRLRKVHNVKYELKDEICCAKTSHALAIFTHTRTLSEGEVNAGMCALDYTPITILVSTTQYGGHAPKITNLLPLTDMSNIFMLIIVTSPLILDLSNR